MISINKATLLGSLEERPVIGHRQDGTMVVGLSVKTLQNCRDKQCRPLKAWEEWHRVVIIDPELAIFAADHLLIGDHVYLEGQLVTEQWRDDLHQMQSITKIVLCHPSHSLRRCDDDDLSWSPPNVSCPEEHDFRFLDKVA